MKFDATVTFTLILTAVGIITPAINTLLINRHKMKLFKLTNETERIKLEQSVKLQVLSDYVSSASTALSSGSATLLTDYSSKYAKALLYVDDETSLKMIKLNLLIFSAKPIEANDLLNELLPNIRHIALER